MPVAFNQIPGDLRAPLFYAEFNPGAPAYSGISRQLVIGRKVAAGALVTGKPQNVGGTDPVALGGVGSMLAEMIAAARWHNPTGELWAMAVADPVGGVAAAGAIVVAGPATVSGTLVVYIAGARCSIGVGQGDTAASIATALVARIGQGYVAYNRRFAAPVIAAVDGTNPAKIVLTARHTGVEGNAITLAQGLDGDEFDPPGVTLTLTAMTGGAGEVDLAAAFAALGAEPFDWICAPYASLSQLNTVRDFLSDTGAGRWGPTVGLGGHYITAKDGSLSTLTVFGAARNDRHATILGLRNTPTAPWVAIAALGGRVAFSKNLGRPLSEAIEIARPLQTLTLDGVRAPKDVTDRWSLADREALYRAGISACTVAADGTVQIDRVITTYQVNAYGQSDNTFLSIETLAIAAYVGRYLRLKVTSTYPRCVLRDDNPRGLQGVATPAAVRNTVIHGYTELSEVGGVVEKVGLFAQYLIVERSTDPNRLNAYLPIDVANQFNVFAANITVNLELTEANASGL